MMHFQKWVFLVLVTISSFLSGLDTARAIFLIEPQIQYMSGTLASEASSGSVTDYDLAGPGAGLRFHWLLPRSSLLLGLEGNIYQGKLKSTTGTAVERDFQWTDTAVHLGLYSNRWRLWLGYSPATELKDKEAGAGSVDVLYKGLSGKLGIGYLFLNHLSMNLEYAQQQYSEKTEGSVTSEIGVGQSITSFKSSVMALSFSFPF